MQPPPLVVNCAKVLKMKLPDIQNIRKFLLMSKKKILVGYLTKMSAIYFGLSPTEVRTLAYQCAVTLTLKCLIPGGKMKRADQIGSLPF